MFSVAVGRRINVTSWDRKTRLIDCHDLLQASRSLLVHACLARPSCGAWLIPHSGQAPSSLVIINIISIFISVRITWPRDKGCPRALFAGGHISDVFFFSLSISYIIPIRMVVKARMIIFSVYSKCTVFIYIFFFLWRFNNFLVFISILSEKHVWFFFVASTVWVLALVSLLADLVRYLINYFVCWLISTSSYLIDQSAGKVVR